MSTDFMKRAIALALENVRSGSGGPFAALIVKEGRIIAEGTNRVTLSNDPRRMRKSWLSRGLPCARGFSADRLRSLYDVRALSMCLGAIYWARPARVFFAATATDAASAGFDDAFIYEELKIAPGGRAFP